MHTCDKCGSKYVLVTITLNNDILMITCTQCGFLKKVDPVLLKKLEDNYEKFKQEIGETQQCLGNDCFV